MARAFLNLIVALLFLAGGVGTFIYLKSTKPHAAPRPIEEKVWAVPALKVDYLAIQPEISAFGSLVSGRTVELGPRISGMLVEVSDKLLEGAEVRTGEVLARIDPFEYEIALSEAEADLAEATARLAELDADLQGEQELLINGQEQLALATRDFERRKSLAERGVGSTKARDDAEMQLSSSERYIAQRRQAINRLKARMAQQLAIVARREAQVKRATRNLEYTTITAPFDGYVGAAAAAIGMTVTSNAMIARLIDLSRLEVRFELTNEEFSRLISEPTESGGLIGRLAVVRWKVGGKVFTYTAVIDRVDAEMEANTGGVAMFATLDEPSDRANSRAPVRPGAFVEVVLTDRVYNNVLVVPNRAVSDNGDVYVVGDDDRLVSRKVQVLRRSGNDLIVTADIPPGAWLVTNRFPEIGVGTRVEVLK